MFGVEIEGLVCDSLFACLWDGNNTHLLGRVDAWLSRVFGLSASGMDAASSRASCDHHRRYTIHLRKSTSFFASLSSDRLSPNLDVRDRTATVL